MKSSFLSRTFLLLLLAIATQLNASNPSPEEVVVVANINSPESLELANYYIHQRNIPRENLLVVQTSLEETISRESFVNEILNPIRTQLIEKGLVAGDINPEKKDYHGRFEFYAYKVHFKYLVTCLGIPLKVDNKLIPEPDAPKNVAPIFRKTHASVDSDLALLTAPNKPYISWEPNPLFEIKNPSLFDYTTAISVCRLDGPSLDDAKHLISSALIAERQNFLHGRAYIDLHNQHKDGNLWLRQAASQLRAYGYDVDTIPTSHHWSILDRHVAPAIYFGWYKSHASGPTVTTQTIPDGAIAAHIHSYSAGTLRSIDRTWVGPIIHAGYAVSFGNVYEPYLQLTLRPDRFIESLLNGNCVGDASIYAQSALSWQNVTIGDPLYRPFKNSNQWNPETLLSDLESDPYERIVALNRIADQNKEKAIELALNSYSMAPSLPFAFKIIFDYSAKASPTLIDLMYDFIISTTEVEEVYAPEYFICVQKLWDAEDIERYRKMVMLLEDNITNWHPTLQEAFRNLILQTHQ